MGFSEEFDKGFPTAVRQTGTVFPVSLPLLGRWCGNFTCFFLICREDRDKEGNF